LWLLLRDRLNRVNSAAESIHAERLLSAHKRKLMSVFGGFRFCPLADLQFATNHARHPVRVDRSGACPVPRHYTAH
jgi:hypothetical protein